MVEEVPSPALTAERLLACPLVVWDGTPGACNWCGGELPKLRRRWCSDDCTWAYAKNHEWNAVRSAALERDQGCVKCRDEGVPITARPLNYPWPQDGVTIHLEYLPDPEGKRLPWRSGRGLDGIPEYGWVPCYQTAMGAFFGALWDEMDVRSRLRIGRFLEVNHIEPRNGRGYETGCWHHLDGVETLCRWHHVRETIRQRQARRDDRQAVLV